MKSVVRKILEQIGRLLRIDLVSVVRKTSSNLIIFLYKSTGVNLLHISLQQMGIHKGTGFKQSGEQFLLETIVKPHISKDDVLVDVGANIGNYSEHLLRLFPDNRTIAYEPNPSAFKILKQNIKIESYQLGCGKSVDERNLFFAANNPLSTQASFSSTDFHTTAQLTSVSVACVRLDNHLASIDATPIGILKIDAEGHDFEVLQGLEKLISQCKFIQFEFNEYHILTRTFIKDFHELLSPTHDLFRLDSQTLHDLRKYHPYNEIFRYQNIVAVRKDISKFIIKYIQ